MAIVDLACAEARHVEDVAVGSGQARCREACSDDE